MAALAAGHDAAVQMIETTVVRVHQHGACISDNRRLFAFAAILTSSGRALRAVRFAQITSLTPPSELNSIELPTTVPAAAERRV